MANSLDGAGRQAISDRARDLTLDPARSRTLLASVSDVEGDAVLRMSSYLSGAYAGNARVAPWRTGVHEAKDANAQLFAFTLDKSSGAFSPTTRYRDYAISPSLIHWESQSMTRADSNTGLRHRNHERDGRSIMLFSRLRTDQRFWFLDPATYRGYIGERPMAITWELHTPLSGDLYQSFAAAVA